MTQLMANQRRITVPRKRTRVGDDDCRPPRPHHRTPQRLSPRPLRNLRTSTRTRNRLRREKLNHRTNIRAPRHRRQNRLTHIRQNITHRRVRQRSNRTHHRQRIRHRTIHAHKNPCQRTTKQHTPKQHQKQTQKHPAKNITRHQSPKKNGKKIGRRGRGNHHPKPLHPQRGYGGRFFAPPPADPAPGPGFSVASATKGASIRSPGQAWSARPCTDRLPCA